MTNKFLARGITKDNEFVIGYPFCIKEKWYILEKPKIEEVLGRYTPLDAIVDWTEIKQAPDRCLDFKDKNGKMLCVFEGDKITNGEEDFEVFFSDSSLQWRAKNVNGVGSLWALFQDYNIEIIGNTHGIEEKIKNGNL